MTNLRNQGSRPTGVLLSISSGSRYVDPVMAILQRDLAAHSIDILNTREDFGRLRASDCKGSVFLNFDNGVIVPSQVLNLFDFPLYNFHSAPPEYPGRDPHHFAIYDDAPYFGATLHEMAESVDAGPIIDCIRFPKSDNDTHATLWKKGLDSGLQLFERHVPNILAGVRPPETDIAWGERKYARKDFHAFCKLTPDMEAAEVDRRVRAFHVEGYHNITLEKWGRTFALLGGNSTLPEK
jgi:methionyl-tRNA formyltransferase